MKKFLFALAAAWLFSATAFCQTKVIAHRGYWDTTGSYENTISSIRNAGNLGVFGSELDVYITTDDVLVVHHDATIQGHKIDESSYENDLKDITLPNGEKLPTLEAYLLEGKKFPNLKVVVELKHHTRWVDQDRCVLAVVNLVRKLHMQNQVDYISFNMNMCKALIRLEPSADVYYLNGETSPADLKTLGFAGLDYEQGVMTNHPEWIKEAHDLGLKVNVWTVNDPAKIQSFIDQGVDFITTNNPVEAKKLAEEKKPR